MSLPWGTSPRYCKNLLLFIAPDRTKCDTLFENVSQFLAWDSIVKEKQEKILNLDTFQEKQAHKKQEETDTKVDNAILETYQWLLVPSQSDPQSSITWEELKLPGQDSFILRASRKALHEEYLITKFAPFLLNQLVLDAYLWQNVNHIEVKTLWKYLTNYLYLPRLKNAQVLLNTVQEGVAALLLTENFAAADGYDEAKQRYLGLKSNEYITVTLSQQSLVVKPDIALKQIQEDTAIKESQISTIEKSENTNLNSSNSSLKVEDRNSNSGYNITQKEQKQPQKQLRRFYGVVDLDPVRVARDVGVISQEILQHLTGLVDANVQITLEIQVQLSEPVPDHILRTVNENCRTLKFKTHSFEEE